MAILTADVKCQIESLSFDTENGSIGFQVSVFSSRKTLNFEIQEMQLLYDIYNQNSLLCHLRPMNFHTEISENREKQFFIETKFDPKINNEAIYLRLKIKKLFSIKSLFKIYRFPYYSCPEQ